MRKSKNFYYDSNGDLTSYDFKEHCYEFSYFNAPNYIMFYKIDYNNAFVSAWGSSNDLFLKILKRLYAKKML